MQFLQKNPMIFFSFTETESNPKVLWESLRSLDRKNNLSKKMSQVGGYTLPALRSTMTLQQSKQKTQVGRKEPRAHICSPLLVNKIQ